MGGGRKAGKADWINEGRKNEQTKQKQKKKIGDQGSGDITQPSSVEVYETATV